MILDLDKEIKRFTDNAEYERTHGNLQGCLGFRQLAEWLKDYKRLLEQELMFNKIRAEIEQLRIHKAEFLTSDGKVCVDSQAVFEILDKYKAESEREA